MSKILVPAHVRRQVQMSKPVVFWWSKKLGHIMVPPHWSVPEPVGYERIECRHAHEVDAWSERLRQQEKRILEMDMEQRYYFEEPIRAHMLEELKKNYREAKDPTNKAFLARAIEKIMEKRKNAYAATVEGKMACESRDGVAS